MPVMKVQSSGWAGSGMSWTVPFSQPCLGKLPDKYLLIKVRTGNEIDNAIRVVAEVEERVPAANMQRLGRILVLD